ncbi:MAG: ABC transporter permease [Clostridia bacterium]|nr:ABC transporter permease [Clostridia bacterium]
MALFLSVLEQGLIYAILALGVYITFKILDFPDMSVDSSFPLGVAVTAMMMSKGISPLLTLPASMIAGALAGMLTGLIHVRLKVRDLLAGIIVMTGLYSVNLHIAGRSNVQLFMNDTIFKNAFVSSLPFEVQTYVPVIILALLTLLVKIIMDLYLATRSGFLLRATGDNPTLVATLAKDSGSVKIMGPAIANALVALSGCVMCQYQRYFDISMGTGTLVLAVASVIVGTQLLKGIRFLRATTAVVLGSILYKACVALALNFGLSPFDLKLVTAVLLLVIIILGSDRKKVKHRA